MPVKRRPPAAGLASADASAGAAATKRPSRSSLQAVVQNTAVGLNSSLLQPCECRATSRRSAGALPLPLRIDVALSVGSCPPRMPTSHWRRCAVCVPGSRYASVWRRQQVATNSRMQYFVSVFPKSDAQLFVQYLICISSCAVPLIRSFAFPLPCHRRRQYSIALYPGGRCVPIGRGDFGVYRGLYALAGVDIVDVAFGADFFLALTSTQMSGITLQTSLFQSWYHCVSSVSCTND
jgi:hypothetical protein